MLYQLSYCRPCCHGQGGSRTPDTTIFSRVLYQLSYLANLSDPTKIRPTSAEGAA